MASSSNAVVLRTLGGSIRRDGAGCVRLQLSGAVRDLPARVARGAPGGGRDRGVIASVAYRRSQPLMLSTFCLVPLLILGPLLVIRRRRMGRCIVDRHAGVLVRMRWGRVIERWPLAGVRLGRSQDIFHRGFTARFWLTATVPDGRALRLGKGSSNQVDQALARMTQR